MRRQVAFVAPLPPPVHGFSTICAAMLERLAERAAVTVFDRAPRGRANPWRFLLLCLRNKQCALYVGLSGGLGQLIDLPYLVIGRLFRLPIFIHHHSFAYINSPTALNRWLFKWLRGEVHIVLSQLMGAQLTEMYGLDPAKVRVISNAAFSQAEPDADRLVAAGTAPLRLSYLSAVSVEKGIVEFFEVLKELKRLGIEYRAKIAGPIDPMTERAFADLLAASDDVEYCGAVYADAKERFYRTTDVFLFPTGYVNEAEPLVVLEAMQSGAYVIACERGAIAEMLANGAGAVFERGGFIAGAVRRIRDFSHDREALRKAQGLARSQARRMFGVSSAALRALLDEIAEPQDNERTFGRFAGFLLAAAATALLSAGPRPGVAADVDYRDTLEKAVTPLLTPPVDEANELDLSAGASETYDDNLYRLPSSTNVVALIGPGASFQDHLTTATAGLDGQWYAGRQQVTFDLRADENRFAQNTGLNNTSGVGSVIWNWEMRGNLSGELGADYNRSLAGFYNTNVYERDMVEREEYFASARYQLGPHLTATGGFLYQDTTLSAAAAQENDNHRKIGDAGLEYATNATTVIGFDYRYTDTTYTNPSFLNGQPFDPDYHEQSPRLILKYALSEKTEIDAIAGYLRRDYPNNSIGDFSGNIWRLSFQWTPTEKTQFLAAAWRNLQADFTAETDYFVSNAVSLTPTWKPVEKLALSLGVSWEHQDYLGTSLFTANTGQRRDDITAEQVGAVYTPVEFTATRTLNVDVSYRHEHRDSNQVGSSYTDNIAKAGVVFKF